MAGQSVGPAAVVAGHSTPVAYCLTTPMTGGPAAVASAAGGVGSSPGYECLVPAAFNVPWTIAVINPVILVTNISEQASIMD